MSCPFAGWTAQKWEQAPYFITLLLTRSGCSLRLLVLFSGCCLWTLLPWSIEILIPPLFFATGASTDLSFTPSLCCLEVVPWGDSFKYCCSWPLPSYFSCSLSCIFTCFPFVSQFEWISLKQEWSEKTWGITSALYNSNDSWWATFCLCPRRVALPSQQYWKTRELRRMLFPSSWYW